MHSHTATEVDSLITNHLQKGYSKTIIERAKAKGRETYGQWVRSVKILHKADLEILNLLIELAQEHKAVAEAEKEKLQQLIPNK